MVFIPAQIFFGEISGFSAGQRVKRLKLHFLLQITANEPYGVGTGRQLIEAMML